MAAKTHCKVVLTILFLSSNGFGSQNHTARSSKMKMWMLRTLVICFLLVRHLACTPPPHHSCDFRGRKKPDTLICLFSADISNKTVYITHNDETQEAALCKMSNKGEHADCSSTMFQYKSSNSTILELKLFPDQTYTGNYSCVVAPDASQPCSYPLEDSTTESRSPALVTTSPTNVTAMKPDNSNKTESSSLNVLEIFLCVLAVISFIIAIVIVIILVKRKSLCEGTGIFSTASTEHGRNSMSEEEQFLPIQQTDSANTSHNEALNVHAQNRPIDDVPLTDIHLPSVFVHDTDEASIDQNGNVRHSDVAPEKANQPHFPPPMTDTNTHSEMPGTDVTPDARKPFQAGGFSSSSPPAAQSAQPSGDRANACQTKPKVTQPVIAESKETAQSDRASAHIADKPSGEPGILSNDAHLEKVAHNQNYNNAYESSAVNEQVLKLPVAASEDNTYLDETDQKAVEVYECKAHYYMWVVVEDWLKVNNCEDNLNLPEIETENDSILWQIKRSRALAHAYNKHVCSKDRERNGICKCKDLFKEKSKEIEQVEDKLNEKLSRLENNREALIKGRTLVKKQLEATCNAEPYNLGAVNGLIETCTSDIDKVEIDVNNRNLYTKPKEVQHLQDLSTKCLEWKVRIEKYLETIVKYKREPWKNIIENHIQDLGQLQEKVSAAEIDLNEALENSYIYTAFQEADKTFESSKRDILLNNNKKKSINASEIEKPKHDLLEFKTDIRNISEDEDENDERIMQKEPKTLNNQCIEADENGSHQLCQDCQQLPGELLEAPPDGYCLLHAAAGAMSLLPSHRDAPETMESVKQKLIKEIDNNRLFYKQYFESHEPTGCTFDTIEKEFKRYVEYGDYNSDTCDHIIIIMCNALGVQANVYIYCPNCYAYNLTIILPNRVMPDTGCIHLVLRQTHYDYVDVISL